jgi:general secretion pathway protein E
VEDPIEMVEPAFNQMQVQPGIDLSFADGVRALMRQDPDIIMVGEIRDLATAEMAIQAALTGHLVLSTLHTNDAPSAVMRLLELGVPYYLLEATLIGIMAQRLVRTLCEDCKAAGGELSDEIWTAWRANGSCQAGHRLQAGRLSRMPPDRLPRPHRPVRTADRDRGLQRPQVREETDIQALRRQSVADGMKPLRIAGALKIEEGVTTADEVLKVTAALGMK